MTLHSKTLLFFLLLSYFLTLAFSEDTDCVYTVYVSTGSNLMGGTDAKANVRLSDAYNHSIEIQNLENWGGLMGPGYNYFERGNLDIFSGRRPCLQGPICGLNLTSDGSGSHHGWYVNYVKVTSTGVHIASSQQLFPIERWLATNKYPYELTAIRNNCNSEDDGVQKQRRTHRMIRSGLKRFGLYCLIVGMFGCGFN